MDRREHITVYPKVCHGRVCVWGTRISAFVAYAANLARERVVALG